MDEDEDAAEHEGRRKEGDEARDHDLGGPPGSRSVQRRSTRMRVSSTLAMARRSPAKMPPAPRRARTSEGGCAAVPGWSAATTYAAAAMSPALAVSSR